MRCTTLLLLPLLLSGCGGGGRTEAPPQQDAIVAELSQLPPAALTPLRFEPDTLQMTFTDTSRIISGRFYAFNTGDTPFVVNKVKLSCGCTNIKWSKAAIPPGDSGTFFVSVNTAEIKKGRSFKHLTLFGNMQGIFKQLTVHLNYIK